MTSKMFLEYISCTLDFLGDVFLRLWKFLEANPWLLSMVIAPTLVVLIIFGVNIAFSLITRKKDERKGER